ncbi:MAG: T9SS type A sorting domain-containing protein [Bacteroidia bacterium]|nr:T9SS type A sorting domain-containing protein [Bacteroidia bacterium]NNF31616.1 T9SS type A sorting domain-containing protein [Flavobacteriaceae bacterium]MBT8275274.1 T9SS type A sorting domain-containing protein [Bacteroidia bacterium]NNJ83252.1 T9SS type A sorting domain-containing protein [Flavobacteriaceae bacterium]NNK53306.1 T9SS type A sorting domain-containing protein [Flavobacteriaceae bacterium]
MKKALLYFFLFAIFISSYAQDEDNYLPVSWEQNIQTSVTPIELPLLDLSHIQQEDMINDRDKSLPWRYGIKRDIPLDIQEQGVLTELPNGDKIWQVAIKSTGAINLSINFDQFYIPGGGRLHFYNDDRTDVSKTYSRASNRPNKRLGAWFVSGEIIWIEYYQPFNVAEKASLVVEGLIHGYRMGEVNAYVNAMRGLNDSGDCNYDVNCPIGEDFDDKKDLVKKAVTLLNLGNGYLCSAVLMNNTARDKTPYLLTANHCLDFSDPALWSVRFNWVSPNPVCGTENESGDIETNFTMSGAALKAKNTTTDFALVELYNEIPGSWDVTFAGWDNSDDLPLFEVGIHHPNGDIMKICRDDSGAIKENANGTEVWLIKGVSVGNGDGWEIGTTESGSSGSPLFNEDGRVIGQLYAGQSFCNGIQNNGDYDIYGRLGVSWAAGSTADSRLMEWLDPGGTGQTNMDGMQNILSVPENEITGQLEIYPNPASSEITVMNSRYPNLVYKFYTVTGQQLSYGSVSSTMNTINVESYARGVYFLHLIDEDSGAAITKKIIISR